MKKKPRPPVTPPPKPNEPQAMLSGILGGPPSSPLEVKTNLDSLIEKGQKILTPLKELQKGRARGDRLITSKDFYERYRDEPSGWCPDSPAAVDIALDRLGMAPVFRGGKGRGKSHKWWELEAKDRLMKRKLEN